jgi:hypothetical protein
VSPASPAPSSLSGQSDVEFQPSSASSPNTGAVGAESSSSGANGDVDDARSSRSSRVEDEGEEEAEEEEEVKEEGEGIESEEEMLEDEEEKADETIVIVTQEQKYELNKESKFKPDSEEDEDGETEGAVGFQADLGIEGTYQLIEKVKSSSVADSFGEEVGVGSLEEEVWKTKIETSETSQL